jgi:tRNA dimethylallyltransferase
VAPADRRVLHQRIEQRFRAMLEQGFVAEVERLRARGDLDPDKPSMRAVGYRQVWAYLDGRLDRAAMVERGIAATRQFAKRQLTWLRAEAEAAWMDSTDRQLMDRVIAAVRERRFFSEHARAVMLISEAFLGCRW